MARHRRTRMRHGSTGAARTRAAVARLIMLERKVLIRDVPAGMPEAMKQAMPHVRDSKLTAAVMVADEFPELGDLSRRASERPR